MKELYSNLSKIFKKVNTFFLLVVVLSFILGWQLGHRDLNLRWQKYTPSVTVINREPPQNTNIDFKLFWDTWDLISRQYLDKKAIDPEKLYYGAIQGMVSAIGDPYTVFLPPEQQKNTKEELNGSFEGVGIELGFDSNKRLIVVSPLDGTPAFNVGIKPQDIIAKIDDKTTLGMSREEAVRLIRGPKGTLITLSIVREGDNAIKEYQITRDTIIVKSVTGEVKEHDSKKSGVIKLSRFGDRTETEWNEVVSDLLSKAVDSFILDLRNNPGGYLDGAVFIASEFLESGDVVLQENSQGVRVSYKVNRFGRLLNQPLVVLLNKGSASASEIVAGALQDRKRAKLVGEKSFGKGTIQDAQDLSGGSGIHITIAKWLTPGGKWVNETEGLEPDIKVESPETDEVIPKVDPQMDKALEVLYGK